MTTPELRRPLRSPWLIAFAVLVVAQLLLVATRVAVVPSVVSWMLAPLLAIWVWRASGPALLILALAFCWVSDLTGNPRLIGLPPSAVYLGVAAFAVADVLLLIVMLRSRPRRWARVWVGTVYVVAAGAVLFLAGSRLGGALRVVTLLYLVLLVAMAASSLLRNVWAAVGAALIFASQLLVVLEVAGLIPGIATWYRLLVLTLYPFGLAVLAAGMTARVGRSAQPGSSTVAG